MTSSRRHTLPAHREKPRDKGEREKVLKVRRVAQALIRIHPVPTALSTSLLLNRANERLSARARLLGEPEAPHERPQEARAEPLVEAEHRRAELRRLHDARDGVFVERRGEVRGDVRREREHDLGVGGEERGQVCWG